MTSLTTTHNPLIEATVNTVHAKSTKHRYRVNIAKFLAFAAGRPFERTTVLAYIASLGNKPAHYILHALTPIKALAREAFYAGAISGDERMAIEDIKAPPIHGEPQGTRLTDDQVRRLMATDMSGRDRVAIGLMLYGGLRRAEAVAVTVDQIATIDGQPVIRNLHGKGGRVRTVPIPAWLFDEVYRLGMLDGPVLRNERGGPLSAGYLRDITRRHTAAVGLRDIAPHDLRRTKGAIAHAKGVPMTRIRDEYGHSSVLVTERYVGAGVDLKHPVCDALPEVG